MYWYNQVIIPASITSIGSNAFSGCTGVTELELYSDAGIDSTASSIIRGVSTNIKKITFDYNGVIPFGVIDPYSTGTFQFLTDVVIRSGITGIGNQCFHVCPELTNVSIAREGYYILEVVYFIDVTIKKYCFSRYINFDR